MLLQPCILAIVRSSPAWACDEDKSEFPLCAFTRGSLWIKRTCADLAGPGEEISPRLSQHLPSLLDKTIFKFYWETSWVLWGKEGDEYPRCAIERLKQESFLAPPPHPHSLRKHRNCPKDTLSEWSGGGRGLFPRRREGPTVILCPPPAALGCASSESPTACDSYCKSHEVDHHDMCVTGMANTNSEIRFGFFQAFVPLSMQWEQIRNGWWGFYYCLTRSFCKNKYGATGQWKDPGKCKDAKNRPWAYHTGILLSFSSPVFLRGHLAFHSALL